VRLARLRRPHQLRLLLHHQQRQPKGLGGGIELVGGKINFEAMEVERFGAAVAFGLLENYLAAAARVCHPGRREIEGGVFFGAPARSTRC
jgi:hypothetical protein